MSTFSSLLSREPPSFCFFLTFCLFLFFFCVFVDRCFTMQSLPGIAQHEKSNAADDLEIEVCLVLNRIFFCCFVSFNFDVKLTTLTSSHEFLLLLRCRHFLTSLLFFSLFFLSFFTGDQGSLRHVLCEVDAFFLPSFLSLFSARRHTHPS